MRRSIRRSTRGKRFRLLLYGRALRRHRRIVFVLGVLLFTLWFSVDQGFVGWPQPQAAGWFLAGGFVSIAYWLFSLLAPTQATVQAKLDHLRIRTPIYRLNISFRRIENMRPVEFVKIFPRSSWPRRDRWLLEPFAHATALSVDLHGWPLHPLLLRLFFHRYFLSPERPGFILLVEDWMTLSSHLQGPIDTFREMQREQARGPGTGVAEILQSGE